MSGRARDVRTAVEQKSMNTSWDLIWLRKVISKIYILPKSQYSKWIFTWSSSIMLMTSSSGSDMVAEVTWITTGRICHVILMTLNDMLIKSVSILFIYLRCITWYSGYINLLKKCLSIINYKLVNLIYCIWWLCSRWRHHYVMLLRNLYLFWYR